MSAPERLHGLRADRAGGSVRFPELGHPSLPPRPPDYRAIRDSADFTELRRRTLRFTLPATAYFMTSYLVFVLLSAYAPGFMGTPAIGAVNIGMLIGLFQFVSTMALVGAYCFHARTEVDPVADAVRDRVEGV